MNFRIKYLVVTLLLLLMVDLASASVFCDRLSIDQSWITGNTAPQIVLTCSNTNNETTIINKIGSYFSIDKSSLPALSSGNTITFLFDNSAPIGNFQGIILFSNSSLQIPVNLAVNQSQQSPSDILVFPTNKIITVTQETEKTQNILITVPPSYPRTITIQSVDFNPGTETIRFGDLNLGNVLPGQTTSIPIVFSAKGAQVGTYQTGLNIFATDSNGKINLPVVNLQMQVTAGISPVTNETFSTSPSCSLSGTIFNLNSTYSFNCANVANNIEVNVHYNPYFEGISADLSSGIYTYRFKPIKFGNTDFIASFSYRGSPIFQAFKQEVKISASGASIPGTDLRLVFTPFLDQIRNNQEVIIQLVDNKSGSLVFNPVVYVNAIPLNSSSNSFPYRFQTGISYSIRGVAPGYNDIVQSLSLNLLPLEIRITPSSGDATTSFTIDTLPENATLYLDGIKINNPYTGLLSIATHTIESFKEGYLDAVKNITITDSLTASPSGEFKKDTTIIYTLSKNVSWAVIYQKSKDSPEEILTSGTGNIIELIPKKTGVYTIKSGTNILAQNEIEGWTGKIFGIRWYYYLIVGVIIGLLYVYSRKTSTSSSNVNLSPYHTRPNT